MLTLVKRFWNDERGFIVSAEMVLIVTIGVLGMIVGINSVTKAVNAELNDVASAFGSLNQSYWYAGSVKFGHAGVAGSAFADRRDFCDCTTIVPTVPGAKTQFGPPPVAAPALLPKPVPLPGPRFTRPPVPPCCDPPKGKPHPDRRPRLHRPDAPHPPRGAHPPKFDRPRKRPPKFSPRRKPGQ